MFVLYGIDTRTGKPELVTQNESAAALRRMWSAYASAAIGDLEGSADDVETKPGTDRVRAVALSRAIVQAQRAHQRDEAAPAPEPAEDNEPEDDPAPRPSPRAARLPPLHRHANDNVPCPVADCIDSSAAYTSTLPVELRPLCKRHRDNAQANRSKGMTVADALETVLASGRARLARANATANKPPVAAAPGPQVERASESDDSDAWGRAIVAEMDAARLRRGEQGGQVLRMDRDPPPASPIDEAMLSEVFNRLDALPDETPAAPSDALTRADFAAVLRELRGTLRVAFDVAIARLESPR